MTDTVSPSNDGLESLLAQYEAGITNYETSDIAAWLNARGEIENRYDEMTPEQTSRLENADSELVEKAGMVAARMASTPGGSLRELRQATPHPSEQWWWYLDVLSHVSDHYESGAETKPPATTASRLLTIVELVVLAIAIFLLVQRLLPAPTAPAPTPFPTPSPAPTATVDTVAFDISQATTFKAPNDVIEVSLPKNWKSAPSSSPGKYTFYYGADSNPAVVFSVQITEPADLISGPTPPKDAKEAMEAVRASFDSQMQSGQLPPTSKIAAIAPIKLGKLDGTGFIMTVPDSSTQPGVAFDFRVAPLAGSSKIVFAYVQSGIGLWPTAQPITDKMFDSLVVNASAIPTATPTNTPIAPQLTLTALQAQIATVEVTQTAVQASILALTPTETPLPTQQATGPATSAATPAAGS